MPEETLTQRDILLQMMKDVQDTRREVENQRVLLTEHVQSSIGRDRLIKEIKDDVERIEVRVGKLEGFKIKAITIWGAAWSFITLFAVWALDNIFNVK
jgi:hypothetical protein